MKLEINKELVVSTAHLTEYTCNTVIQNLIDDCLLCGFKNDYGWRIVVTGLCKDRIAMQSIPQSLQKLILIAESHNCKWLVLDCDGPEIEGLETFDW